MSFAIDLAKSCLEAGAYMFMIESEGITEEVNAPETLESGAQRASGGGY